MTRLGTAEQVEALYRRGSARYPSLKVDAGRFSARVHQLGELPEERFAEDFFLAAACAEQDPAAMKLLDAAYLQELPRVLARLGLRDAAAEDVVQKLRELLFAGAPRIEDYRGRGSLAGWLRVMAVRVALKAQKRMGRMPEGTLSGEQAEAPGEVELLRESYRREFESACAAVVKAMAPRDRRLLQRHYLDQVSLDALAEEEGVHRATAARWLAAARMAIRHETRRRVAEKLDLGATSLSSVGRWVAGDLQVSLRRLLASADD